MPRIPAAPAPPPSVLRPSLSTAHSLLVLSEYSHTVDALSLDLSRHFADLREVDGVLSASTTSITQKIYELVDLIENTAVSGSERLAKFREVEEEAQRLKLGGEDKIRVASQAADNLLANQAHLSNLLSSIVSYDTSFTPSHLYLRTTYPHIPPRPVQAAVPLEGGRRRRAAGASRGQLGGMLAVEALSPVKSRGRVRDGEEPQFTARREREGNSTAVHKRSGRVNKTRKVEQTTVPAHVHRTGPPSAESVVSITSHAVQPLPSTSRTSVPTPPHPAPQLVASAPQPEDGGGAEEGDQDAGRYCYCHGPSFGEMVGCDDDACVYEWFHLGCIGMTTAPKGGTWYCNDCKAKRAGNKKSRSNKRPAGGGSGVAAASGAVVPANGPRAGRGKT